MIRAILATTISIVVVTFVFQLIRWCRIVKTDPDRARVVRTAFLFRLLLVVGLALGYPEIYEFIDGLLGVSALPQLIQHLAALGVAYDVQRNVLRIAMPVGRTRVANRVSAIALFLSAVGLITFYLLGPLPNGLPDISSRHALSPYVAEYQLIIVGTLSLTAGSLFWLGASYSRHASPGPLRTALRLIELGGGLTVISLIHRLVHLVVIAAGGSLPWRESGVDGVQLYLVGPAVVFILLGITMPRWGPRLALLRHRRRLHRQLRPLWFAVYHDDRDIALLPPRSAFVEALLFWRLEFYLHRRVVEIRDGFIGPLRRYIDPDILANARNLAIAEGIAEPEASAIAEAAGIATALRARARQQPPRHGRPVPLRAVATDLDGEATWLASISRALDKSKIVMDSLRNAEAAET